MKKLLALLLVLLICSACGEKGYSKLTNGSDVIFEGPNTSYTKDDLYKSLKVMSEDTILQDIMNKIAQVEGIDTDSFQEQAEEDYAEIVEAGYEYYITYYYGSADVYKEAIISSLVSEELKKNYILANYDANVSVDAPVKMQVAYYDNEDSAKQCIADVKAGTTFDTAALNNGYSSDAAEKIYVDSDDLPSEVKSYAQTGETGLSDIIVVTTTSTDDEGNETQTAQYYVVNITDNNVENFKEEYVEQVAAEVEDETIQNYYLSKYDIEFYDQDLYEIMSASYEVLK